MEKVKVSVPLDFSALTAEGCANWSTALSMSEQCGFARLHVSSEPGGNLRLWRAPRRHTLTGAGLAPAELAMNWNRNPGTKLPPCGLLCMSLDCAYQLFLVLGMLYRHTFSPGTAPLRLHVSKKQLRCLRLEAGFGSSTAAVLMGYDYRRLSWPVMALCKAFSSGVLSHVAQVFCLQMTESWLY